MTPFLLSAFVAPGAGQLYKRQFVKGGLILGLCLFGFTLLFLDLYFVVHASLEAEPLLEAEDLFERAAEIRHGISLHRFMAPLLIIGVSYIWGVIDILWTMRKGKAPVLPTTHGR
jgi:hypothetical protein